MWRLHDGQTHQLCLFPIASQAGIIPQLVCDLKVRLSHDVSVDGPALAAHPIRAEILDEYHLSVVPAMLGGGKRVLNLLDERSFTNGMVYPTLA